MKIHFQGIYPAYNEQYAKTLQDEFQNAIPSKPVGVIQAGDIKGLWKAKKITAAINNYRDNFNPLLPDNRLISSTDIFAVVTGRDIPSNSTKISNDEKQLYDHLYDMHIVDTVSTEIQELQKAWPLGIQVKSFINRGLNGNRVYDEQRVQALELKNMGHPQYFKLSGLIKNDGIEGNPDPKKGDYIVLERNGDKSAYKIMVIDYHHTQAFTAFLVKM